MFPGVAVAHFQALALLFIPRLMLQGLGVWHLAVGLPEQHVHQASRSFLQVNACNLICQPLPVEQLERLTEACLRCVPAVYQQSDERGWNTALIIVQ
jgi:hypothetical protein